MQAEARGREPRDLEGDGCWLTSWSCKLHEVQDQRGQPKQSHAGSCGIPLQLDSPHQDWEQVQGVSSRSLPPKTLYHTVLAAQSTRCATSSIRIALSKHKDRTRFYTNALCGNVRVKMQTCFVQAALSVSCSFLCLY